MPKSLQELASDVLRVLAMWPRDEMGLSETDGKTISKVTGLSPAEINDAVTLLVHSGYAEWRQYLGTAPYLFGAVGITPVGRYEHERTSSILGDPLIIKPREGERQADQPRISLPPAPIGSPYGFTDEDWEFIADRKDRSGELIVVLGYQFSSEHYDSEALKTNLESMFHWAVGQYNAIPTAVPTVLSFRALAAGYGEHLFNEIARDIIAADIAVFETSDLNPNVMLELGVALTWGVRVLPIKKVGRPKPPSDISGQTWADYNNSASEFVDAEHNEKLIRMVERAVRKKARK
jgi:hypothetical protein